MPWISFCMTTYKRAEFLKRTLQSILRQTFSDFEIIISDNDPNGSAKEVINELNDPRIYYEINGENLGMVRSFNKSLGRATGEFILMITDDDPVYPDLLETLHKLHVDFPGYGMYLGGCDWLCLYPDVGRLYHLKVGTNSCLSNEHEVNYTK